MQTLIPQVALVPWGDTIEDFLEPLGLDLAGFRDEMDGGWLFGYVEALATAGVGTTIVCCSKEVRSLRRWIHKPSQARMLVLPYPSVARRLRSTLEVPLAWDASTAVGPHGRLRRTAGQLAYQLSPYLATPLWPLAREARRAGWRALLCQEYEYPRSDLCAVLAKALRIPAFATFQGGDLPRTALEARIRRRLMPAWTGLIIAAPAEAGRVRRAYNVPAERIVTIANPLAVERWQRSSRDRVRGELGIPASAIVVVWHGRIDIRQKGLDVLFDAWAQLSEIRSLPQRRLLIIGAGADDRRVKERLRAPSMSDVIWVNRYVLQKTRVAELLGAADIYAFASRHEGFAVAPLEAMAAELPVVAAATPGVTELFPDGRRSGGLVVPVGDARALAQGLEELVNKPEERRQLGARARDRVRSSYSLEAIGSRLRNVLLRESSPTTSETAAR